jgi:hypothetical protein
MAKVASVKLKWKRSVSADAVEQTIDIVKDGVSIPSAVIPTEVEEFVIDVPAQSSVQFTVTTKDSEGLVAVSGTYSFSLGDLENPQPATDLGHEILAINEVDDA